MNKYQFTFKGEKYECIGDDKVFDIEQFKILIELNDWTTISNRIINQLKWGPNIKKIK